ncbi:tetratricopeptide repeat protein [Amycolatopsis sp. DG1A-15b]|uniref:KGGVGR-motif variant AAA ATPase n=1 Tax=Amycolatopsis sp. DG1A-15b TaxID=3052846 RepID=UPI00255C202F|nr:tetratricopeptide repeat protein [Amycolatopsis sp. DG1A-15b]WIX92463.1 tetratricopeptide repeat protein [Amycolatopsis sp. DG1A-15b]
MFVTFYSYKGGVGRTFCLANVAVQLSPWGYRVLCVDWDLYSPGLHSYFAPWLSGPPAPGVVEIIGADTKGPIEWQRSVVHVEIPEVGELSLLSAGRGDADYVTRLRAISWPHLFDKYDLGWRLETLRDEMNLDYDFVLVDSHAGVTEVVDVCTAQLPDILMLCLNPNRQNIDGALDVVRRTMAVRDESPYDKSRLLVVPVLSRLDTRDERARSGEWRQRMAATFDDQYRPWTPKDVAPIDVLDATTVPHLPKWSFGEEIVQDEHLANVAALLAHELAEADLLVSNSEDYVAAARERGRRPRQRMLSHSVFVVGTSSVADDLRLRLSTFGVQVAHPEALSTARHFVVVLDEGTPAEAVRAVTEKVRATPDTPRLLFAIAQGRSDVDEPLNTWHVLWDADNDVDGEIARKIAGAVADAIDDSEDGRGLAAQVLARIGEESLGSGRIAGARDYADRAGKLAKRWLVELASLAGQVAYHDDDLAEAERLLQEVVLRASRSPQARRAHLTLGRIAMRRGAPEDACAHYDQVLDSSEDRALCLAALRAKADVADITGRYPDALDCLTQAVALAEGTEDAPVLALALGQMYADRADPAEAEPWLRDAVGSGKLGPYDHFAALRRLGIVADHRGNDDVAAEHLHAALAYAVDHLDAERVVDAAADYLDVLRRLGRTGDIDFALRRAYAALAGGSHEKARLLSVEADVRVRDRQFARAKVAYTEARTLYQLVEDRSGEVGALIGLARAEESDGTADDRLLEARRLVAGLRGPEADWFRRQIDDLRGW